MGPNLGPAGLRGARFQAVFAEASSSEITWNPWGMFPICCPK